MMASAQGEGGTTASGLSELLERLARHGDERTWEDFIAAQGGTLRAVTRVEIRSDSLAEDAVQEALLGIHRALPEYRALGDAEARQWIAAIARNAARNLRRTDIARRRRERAVGRAGPDHDDPPHGEDDERMGRVRHAMAGLPEGQRQALELRICYGLSYDEAARRLGMKPSYVRVLVSRAVQTLRRRLAPDGRDLPAGLVVAMLHAHAAAPGSAAMPGLTTTQGLSSRPAWLLPTAIAVGALAIAAGRSPGPVARCAHRPLAPGRVGGHLRGPGRHLHGRAPRRT